MILIKPLVKVSLVATLLVVALLAGFEQEPLVVFDSFVHIGDTLTPEWTEASAPVSYTHLRAHETDS